MKQVTVAVAVVALGGLGIGASRGSRGGERDHATAASDDGSPTTMAADRPAVVAPAQGVPRGMVAFFVADGCPAGWQPAVLATGRMVVAVTDPLEVGRVLGTPLAGEEDRLHAHPVTGAVLQLPSKAIAAGNGGNQDGAAAGPQMMIGDAAPAPSGLPFAQLTTCVRP